MMYYMNMSDHMACTVHAHVMCMHVGTAGKSSQMRSSRASMVRHTCADVVQCGMLGIRRSMCSESIMEAFQGAC